MGRSEHVRGRVSVRAALGRRKWFIAATTALFAVLALVVNVLTDPVYRAVVRVEIRRPSAPSWQTSPSYQAENLWMYTAAALITSRTLLGQVADQLAGRGLIPDEEPGTGITGLLDSLVQRLPSAPRRLHPRSADGARGRAPTLALGTPVEPGRSSESAAVEWLRRGVRVEPLRDTRLVDIKVEHTRPEAARIIADCIAERFVDYQTSRLAGSDTIAPAFPPAATPALQPGGSETRAPLTGALAANRSMVRVRVRQLDRQLANLTEEASRIRSQQSETRARVTLLESLARSPGTDLSQLPVEMAGIEALRREHRDARARLTAARATGYGEKHPRMLALEAEVRTAERNLQQELRRVIAAQRAELTALAARGEELEATLARRESEVAATEALAEEQSRMAAAGLGDPQVASAFLRPAPPVVIVDPAAVERYPVRPRPLLNFALFLAVGLLAGTGIALLHHGRGTSIQAPEDVEQQLDLPVLGLMPRLSRTATG